MAEVVAGYRWMADDVTEDEHSALATIHGIAERSVELASVVMGYRWVANGVSANERSDIGHIDDIAERSVELAEVVAAYSWVADGIVASEPRMLSDLQEIADKDLDLARTVAAFSWVADDTADYRVIALHRLSEAAPEVAQQLIDMARPTREAADSPGQWDVLLLVGLSGPGYQGTRSSELPWFAETVRLISALAAENWVQDGLDGTEADLLFALQRGADPHGDRNVVTFVHAARSLRDESWASDGLSEAELLFIPAINPYSNVNAVDEGLRFVRAFVNETWLQDGIAETERLLLENIAWLTAYENEATAVGTARALVNIPWISDGLVGREMAVLGGLVSHLSRAEGNDLYVDVAHQAAQLFTKAAWIQDGIDEPEYWMLDRILGSSAGVGLKLALRTVGDPEFKITSEERVINLPFSGPTTLVIIREGQGEPRSMDDLEYAVRGAEALVGEPLPDGIVRVLFDPFEGWAAHFGRYISMPAGTEGTDWYAGAIIHEVGHYYFGSRRRWISEGAAGIIEDIVDYPRIGRAIDANNYPCVHTATIAEFERTGSYDCSYALRQAHLRRPVPTPGSRALPGWIPQPLPAGLEPNR